MKKQDEKIDQVFNKVFEEYGIEEPSVEFAEKAMAKVEKKAKVKSSLRQPILNNKVKWVIGTLSSVFILLSVFAKGDTNEVILLPQYLLNQNLPSFQLDSSLMTISMYVALGFLGLILLDLGLGRLVKRVK